jgi:hypothetical protein
VRMRWIEQLPLGITQPLEQFRQRRLAKHFRDRPQRDESAVLLEARDLGGVAPRAASAVRMSLSIVVDGLGNNAAAVTATGSGAHWNSDASAEAVNVRPPA